MNLPDDEYTNDYENEDVEVVFTNLDAVERSQRNSDFFATGLQIRQVRYFKPADWAPRLGELDPEVIGR